MMRTIALLTATFISIVSCAQSDNNKKAEAIVKELCPGAKIVETEFKGDYYEVEYNCNGVKSEASLSLNFEIISIETETTIKGKTREKIQKKLDKAYSGWFWGESEMVFNGDTTYYKVELLKNGIEENVYFTLDGKYYRPSNMAVSEYWTTGELIEIYSETEMPYLFHRPAKIFDLPEDLREVSGIALISENRAFLVQDELGALFNYDLQREEVAGIIRFADTGDFEDVTLAGEKIFVLRSDGTIFSFNSKEFAGETEKITVPVHSTNLEGLYFDPAKKLLYLASKSEPLTGSKDERWIYQLNSEELNKPELHFSISNNEINDLLKQKYPRLISDNLTAEINPSAIAVHPKTSEIYVLSATDRLLAVFANQNLTQVFPLPSDIYYKPEGLAFSSTGDLYIASEGIKNGFVKGQIFILKAITGE